MPVPEPSIEVTATPAKADVAAVLDGLLAYNEPFLGPRDFCELGVFARTGGRLVGGLLGETGRGFLYVDLFWVAPETRHAGLGSRLLQAAEAEARRRGCHSAWLDTYDFQARPFYEKHGYVLFGTLNGFAGGHARYYLVKRFTLDAAETGP